jgi:hypothetical protein
MGNEESQPEQPHQAQQHHQHQHQQHGGVGGSGRHTPRHSQGGGIIVKSPVETLFRRLHQEAQVPFDPDHDNGHMLVLRQMWSCFNRGDEFKRSGPEWQAVGFQSADPVTDFRAAGLMGAKVTKRVLEKNKPLVEYFLTDVVVLESCLSDGAYYPLMANCVAVLVGVCKLIGLAEDTASANLFKLRDLETAVKEITASHGAPGPCASPALHMALSSSSSSLFSTPQSSFFKNIGTPAAAAARREMQLNSLFQDARSFDLLLLHVMIRFHNNFMRDAIHHGATCVPHFF